MSDEESEKGFRRVFSLGVSVLQCSALNLTVFWVRVPHYSGYFKSTESRIRSHGFDSLKGLKSHRLGTSGFVRTQVVYLHLSILAFTEPVQQLDKSRAGWTQAASREGNITLTRSPTWWLILEINHTAKFQTAPMPHLFSLADGCIVIYLRSQFPLFWVFSFSTIPSVTYHFISYILHPSRPLRELILFIMPLWQFKLGFHILHWLSSGCESWEEQIFPIWFPVSHRIDGPAWSAHKRQTFCLSITLRGDCE